MTAEEFGEIIRERREAMGLTQREFGKLVECYAPSSVHWWETGLAMPKEKTILALGNVLELDEETVAAAIEERHRRDAERVQRIASSQKGRPKGKGAAGDMTVPQTAPPDKPRKVCGLTSMQQAAAIARAANAKGMSYGAYVAALTEEERERIYRKYARYLQLRARMEAGQK